MCEKEGRGRDDWQKSQWFSNIKLIWLSDNVSSSVSKNESERIPRKLPYHINNPFIAKDELFLLVRRQILYFNFNPVKLNGQSVINSLENEIGNSYFSKEMDKEKHFIYYV